MKNIFPILLLGLTVLSSCTKDKLKEPVIKNYLHVSHTRMDDNTNIVVDAQSVDHKGYDMLFLGGDLAWTSSSDSSTMNLLDGYFNFGSPNTLWALGNHDDMNLSLVSFFTNRPSYYSYENNGITYLVIDTQLNDCNIVDEQKALFDAITDTIQSSSHLVILHHKMIWMYDHPIYNDLIGDISNGPAGTCSWCVQSNNFMSELYPKLVEVQNRGTQVLCIGGDLGLLEQTFEYESPEGIFFLASGCNFNQTDNKAITFQHNLTTRELTWKFVSLSEL